MKKWLVSSLFLILLTGCNAADEVSEPETPEESAPEETPEPAQPEPEESEEPEEPLTEIASGLDVPWSINKIGDEFYISERPGTVAYINEDGEMTRQEVQFSDQVSGAAEAGFLGFVLKPNFEESQEAYAYYVYEDGGQSYNKIVSLVLENEGWQESEVLLDDIPTGNVHHGGRLVLNDEGILFATIGDASNPDLAQDPDSVNGKILRLNEEGEFEIYSIGHRNPQGIAWANGKMYAAEHGQSANDEINIIEEGNNYGWPLIEGEQEEEGLEAPFVTTGSDETWAPSGIAINGGMLYAAALRGNAIKVIDLESGEVTGSIEDFGRVRDVYSEENDLYFVTNNTDGRGNPADDDDKLYRMTIE